MVAIVAFWFTYWGLFLYLRVGDPVGDLGQAVSLSRSRLSFSHSLILSPDGVIDGDVESAFIELVWADVDAGETDGAAAAVSRLVLAEKEKITIDLAILEGRAGKAFHLTKANVSLTESVFLVTSIPLVPDFVCPCVSVCLPYAPYPALV